MASTGKPFGGAVSAAAAGAAFGATFGATFGASCASVTDNGAAMIAAPVSRKNSLGIISYSTRSVDQGSLKDDDLTS